MQQLVKLTNMWEYLLLLAEDSYSIKSSCVACLSFMISDSQVQFLAHTVIQCTEPIRKQFIVHPRALAKGHYDSAVLIPASTSDFLESLPVFNREIIRLSTRGRGV